MSALSPQQLTIVNAVLQTRGSINVQARAGCGKTHLIIHGICKAIRERQPNAEVVGMAYNKAAGDELKQRAEEAGLITDWRKLQFGTCHSFGFAVFRKLVPDVKVDEQKVKKIIEEIGGGAKANPLHPYILMSGAIQDAVSLAKQRGFGFLVPVGDRSAWYDLIDHFGIEDDLPENFPVDDLVDMSIDVLGRSIIADRAIIKPFIAPTIDFNDMIIAPLIHKARFFGKDIVIVDEGQDTNPARRALAMAMLRPRYGRLIVVGDDRQAIYGFTGADGDAMDLIAKQMGSTTYPLTVTRRCPKAVVELAKRIVPDFTAHPDAPEGIVREIMYSNHFGRDTDPTHQVSYWWDNENLQYGDAILCRNTRPLVDQAYALIRAGIGCMVEGRAIGKGLIALATKWSRIKTLSALASKLEEYREKETTKWLAKGREEKADAIEDKVGTIQTIITKLTGEGKTQISDLVADIEKLFGDANDEKAPKVVRLCSGHRSKGREWRRVFHLGRTRFLPSGYARKDWQLQQEENLEYVIITRAMEEYIDVVMEAA